MLQPWQHTPGRAQDSRGMYTPGRTESFLFIFIQRVCTVDEGSSVSLCEVFLAMLNVQVNIFTPGLVCQRQTGGPRDRYLPRWQWQWPPYRPH